MSSQAQSRNHTGPRVFSRCLSFTGAVCLGLLVFLFVVDESPRELVREVLGYLGGALEWLKDHLQPRGGGR